MAADAHWLRVFDLPLDAREKDLAALVTEIACVQPECILIARTSLDDRPFVYSWVRFASASDSTACLTRLDGFHWRGARLRVVD
jgi:hypothetical protein